MAFRTMDEFRAALGALVAKANAGKSRSKSRSKRGRKTLARANMAIKAHGREFDTVEQLVAYEDLRGLAPAPATRAASKAPASKASQRAPVPFASPLPVKQTKKGKGFPQMRHAKIIGKALGGFGYCPGAAAANIGHSEALARIGLTRDKAELLAGVLEDTGLMAPDGSWQKDPDKIERVKQLLTSVGGVRYGVLKTVDFESDEDDTPARSSKSSRSSAPLLAAEPVEPPTRYAGRRLNPNPDYEIQGGGAIPYRPPTSDWQWGAAPKQVYWEAYPQYAYDVFSRDNSSKPKKRRRKGASKARRNGNSAVGAKFVPDPLPTNAGPYRPETFPYGVGGIPGCYSAKKNEGAPRGELVPFPATRSKKATPEIRERAARAGLTLSGSTEWPVYDEAHAIYAIQYMARGRGGSKWRPKYASMVRKLASLYPLEDDENRQIWTMYRQMLPRIQKFNANMPSVAALRGLRR